MKKRFTRIMAAMMLLVTLAIPMGMRGQTRESYNVTYSYTDLGDMLYGSYLDASSYWKVPESSGNNALISIPITYQPESNITVTFRIATFGSGNNPSASNTTITAVGKESNSNWTGTGVSSYPSSSSYVNGIMTITKPQNPTTLGELDITMGVNTGVKIFRLQSITVSYTYSGGTPTTYTVTFNAGAGTFVGSTDFPNASNTMAAGTYTLPSATPATGYTFDGWTATGINTPITGSYTVSGNVDFTAHYTENSTPTPGGETLTFDFEEETAHRTSGNNSYTSTNTYSENGATITLTYADAVTTGTPLNGTANVLGRIAKNTTNSPIIHIGEINITDKTITSIAYKTKGVATMSQVLEYSLDNSNWTNILSLSSLPTSVTTKTATNLSITGTSLYLRWTTSVSNSTNNNRDFQLDDIIITYTTSGTPVVETPIIYPNGGEFYPTTQSISISCATQDATIRYTLDGNDPTTSSEVYSEPFTLTATTTVKAKAFKDGMDPSEIASATFTKATVMTVAQAIAATPTTGESGFVYVHGIVSEIVEEYNSQYHNISYNISDDGTTTSAQLEAFRGKNLNNTNFTSNQDILPGDIVTIYGKLTLYGETYELAAGNYLVEHTPHTAVQYDLTVSSLSTNVNAIYVFNAEDETNPLITDGHAGTVQVYDGTSIIVSPDIADGYVLETLIVDGNNITSQVAGGAYTFTMPTHAVTISATAMVAPTPVTYTLATSIVSGKTYIISDGVDRAMGAQSVNFRSAAAVTIDNDVATVSSTEVYEFVITGTEADGYTIYDAKDEGYLYASSSSSNNIGTRDENSDDNSMWTIEFDENSGVTITAKGTNTRNIIRYNYNNGNDRFSCYASSSSLTDPLYLYVKNEPVTTTYTLPITAADFTSNPATGYYFIASPVSENITPSADNGITSGNYDLYFWDEPAHTWRNYKQNSAGTNLNAGFSIENGKGYLYANQAGTTIQFTGTPLTETSKAITLSKQNTTTAHGAWNLIGNPFTEAAYLTDANGGNRAYYIMKEDGSDVIAAEPGTPVAKMNGIFVIADDDNEVVTFSTNAPTNNGKFLALNINQNRGDVIDRAIVNFNEGSELPKLQLFESTKLYIKQNDEDYAVVNGQNQGTLPINFKATANCTYTLNIDTENVEFSTLILHDNLTGEDINLLSRATYSFDATTEDDANRFTLVYSKDDEGTTETLTFYDGDTSSSYVPVYGFYADAYQKVEFIMPAEDLYALTGATINKMTWYLTTPAEVAWGGNFKIYLMETEATTPANYADLTNATLVYDGPLDGTGETLEINFATGFLYEGDNLLVAVHQTETGTYKSATFAGSAVTGAALQGYNYSSLDQVNQAVRDFLPKTTFEFTPGSGAIYYKPKQLQASEIGITSAVLTWEAGDDETSWGVEYKKVTEDTWTEAGTVDQLTITLDNLEAGTEYEAHVKSIYTDGESGWTTIAFATEACEETDKGEVAYTLTDTWGDGWNNNKLRIFLSGTDIMIAELTLTTGSELEGVVKLCYDTDYDLVWVAGNYAYETGFVLTAPDGTIIYEYHGTGNSGGTTPNPGVLTTFQIHNGFTKTIEAYTDNSGYYLIASPVGNVLASNVTNMVDGNYDLYMFDQTGDDEGKQWLNYKANAFSYLEVGLGYLYASESDVTLTFSGTPISSDDDYAVEVNYNASSDFPGLNLLGNPFAEEAYLVNAEGNGLAYHRLNPANNTYVTVDDNSAIPMMEGVFYEAGENDVVVYFSATAPATSKSNLNITVSQGRGMVDNAIVRFGEGNTLRKISLRDNSTKVYIPQNGSEYALVNANEFGEMPVNFKAESNGTYTMSFSNQNVEFGYLHLIDNLTGTDVDLLANPSYSFEAKVSDYASRFKLVFATGNDDSSSDFAFVSNDEIIVNGEGMLQVIDMTGRIISTSQVNGMSSIKLNAAAGVYVLRLNDKTQKIVIR